MSLKGIAGAARPSWALALCAGLYLFGCGNDKPSGPAGGPVEGSADMHCVADDGGPIANETDQNVCDYRPPDAGPTNDGGMDEGEEEEYGDTLYNTGGESDECKYHYEFDVSPVYENYDVNFTLTVTNSVDGSPATGANPLAEVFLSDTHPAPNTDQKSEEVSPGVYKIGPIQFDAPGRWTVRFHVYYNCLDLIETSPHGHAAFYIDVP